VRYLLVCSGKGLDAAVTSRRLFLYKAGQAPHSFGGHRVGWFLRLSLALMFSALRENCPPPRTLEEGVPWRRSLVRCLCPDALHRLLQRSERMR
jgi:hypothetical protein